MKLGILTGGGDCAGLNAAIRSVVRTAHLRFGTTVLGYERGWNGVLEANSTELDPENVRGVFTQGGTLLGSSRSTPKLIEAGAPALIEQLHRDGVDALVAIGGDGTLMTTGMLHNAGFPVVAVPKTIDNDVAGTDVSIGYDTALAVATDAVERLHTTAASHDRVMVLEVMGRHSGHLAAGAGIAGGAAIVLVPERPFDAQAVAEQLSLRHHAGRYASIVVVAEGAVPIPGTAPEHDPGVDIWGKRRTNGMGELVGNLLAEVTGYETRTTVLGHIQRGGSPTATDRLVASRLGAAAVDGLAEGLSGRLAAIHGEKTALVPLDDVVGKTRLLPSEMVDLLDPLTTAGPVPAQGHTRP